MKYIKTFESISDRQEIFNTNKFIVYDPKNDTRVYILEILNFTNDLIETRKHYTYYKTNKKIKKNTRHQIYFVTLDNLEKYSIYYSSDVSEAYKYLLAIDDIKKFNL